MRVKHSSWVVAAHGSGANRYYLLGKRAKTANNPGQWGFFGGTNDPGEKPIESAGREFKEESGLEAHALNYLGTLKTKTKQNHFFLHVMDKQHKPKLDKNETSRHRWVTIAQSKKLNLHSSANLYFKKLRPANVKARMNNKTPVLAKVTPLNIEGKYELNHVHYDQEKGLGNVPHNQEVDYRGFATHMRPSQFKRLTPERDFKDSSIKHLTTAIKNGKSIGSPFLDVAFDSKHKKPAKIMGHEGRTRMEAIHRVHGDIPVLVHIFAGNGMRAKNLSATHIEAMRHAVIPENKTRVIAGPHFDNLVHHLGEVKDIATMNHIVKANVVNHLDNVPMKPGLTPIPEGRVRRFHVTHPDNIENIKHNGLHMDHAKGIEGPKAIYSWNHARDAAMYGHNIVEFHDNPDHYDHHPYATRTNVPKENIVAIHRPWHEPYRIVKGDRERENNLMKNKNYSVDYAQAARHIEKEGLTPYRSHSSKLQVEAGLVSAAKQAYHSMMAKFYKKHMDDASKKAVKSSSEIHNGKDNKENNANLRTHLATYNAYNGIRNEHLRRLKLLNPTKKGQVWPADDEQGLNNKPSATNDNRPGAKNSKPAEPIVTKKSKPKAKKVAKPTAAKPDYDNIGMHTRELKKHTALVKKHSVIVNNINKVINRGPAKDVMDNLLAAREDHQGQLKNALHNVKLHSKVLEANGVMPPPTSVPVKVKKVAQKTPPPPPPPLVKKATQKTPPVKTDETPKTAKNTPKTDETPKTAPKSKYDIIAIHTKELQKHKALAERHSILLHALDGAMRKRPAKDVLEQMQISRKVHQGNLEEAQRKMATHSKILENNGYIPPVKTAKNIPVPKVAPTVTKSVKPKAVPTAIINPITPKPIPVAPASSPTSSKPKKVNPAVPPKVSRYAVKRMPALKTARRKRWF